MRCEEKGLNITLSFLTRVVQVSGTPVTKESVGLRGLPGAPVLLDLQLRWFDLGTALLCSRCLELSDHQELMESL